MISISFSSIKINRRETEMKKILSFVLSVILLLPALASSPIGVVAAETSVYVSADGKIDGFDGTVYTTVDAAFSALGADGGTIYIEGVATLPTAPDLSKFAGKTVNICGYNNTASGNVIQFKNAMKSFLPSGNVTLVFDNITVKHEDGSTTEDWIFPSGGTLTFGTNCLYEHGYRADRNQNLKLYIGAYSKSNGGTINFNAPNVEYAETGSIAGYIGGTTSNFTTTGDVIYNFNAGKVDAVYGGMRNSTTGFATLNGDVYYNFNGATLASGPDLVTGNLKNGVLNGNIFFNIKSGNIVRTLTLGSKGAVTEGYCAFGNTIVSFDGKTIANDGKTLTITIKDGYFPTAVGKKFVIINHSDKLDASASDTITVSSTTLNHYIKTVGGTITPVFAKSSGGNVGAFLGFEACADTNGYVPAISSTPLETNSSGYYVIPESSSVNTVTFIESQETEPKPEPETDGIYLSADGAIDGFDGTVYTDVDSALAALGTDGGKIYIEGTVVFPAKPATTGITGKIEFLGYNNTAAGNVAEFANATICFCPQSAADIVFDKITLKRQDGKTNEAWMSANGGTLEFGSGCLYTDGTRSTDSSALKLYIGSCYSKNGGRIIFNSPYAEYNEIGSMAGYFNKTTNEFTVTGDITYDFNAGIFKNVYAGLRNGTTGYSTLNGDVYYNFNGASATTGGIFAGNHKAGVVNGNLFITFNSGNITKPVNFGNSGSFTEEYTKYGNAVVTINGKTIAADGKTFNVTVSDGLIPENRGLHFLIINHADAIESSENDSVNVASTSLDYNIRTEGGIVKPVFESSKDGVVGKFLGFEITSDTEGLVPAINGKMLKKDGGYYVIEKSASAQTVKFAAEAELISNVTLKSNIDGQQNISAQYSNGDEYILPECPFTPDSAKLFSYWLADGKKYYPGTTVEILKNITFEAQYEDKNAASVYYVNTENGNDSQNGLSPSAAFKNVSSAVSAIEKSGCEAGTVVVFGSSNYENIPAHTKVVTYTNGSFTGDIELSGNTVFDGISLSDGASIYTSGNAVEFTQNSENVKNINLVLADKTEKTSGNSARLYGGSFANVSISDGADTESTYLKIAGAQIKKLSLGSESASCKDVIVEMVSDSVTKADTGKISACGKVIFFYPDRDITLPLDETDFSSAEFTVIYNDASLDLSISENAKINIPDGNFVYACGTEHLFYSVSGVLSVSEEGIYNIKKTKGEGADYLPYPKAPESKYFDSWEKISDGHLKAVFTDNKKQLCYYVSEKSGDDTNAGTSTKAPFKTLTAAVNALDGKDGRVIIMDTAYWSENASSFNVPVHTGTITFEGLSESAVETQIIDYSRSVEANGTTGSLRLQGNSIFKNVSFRAHHYKQMYTNGYDLRLEGKIGYIKGTSGSDVFNLTIGKYAAACENARVYLGADVDIETLNIGHNVSSSITGNTSIIIDGARINKLVLGGTGSKLNDVQIAFVSGSVGSFVSNASNTTSTISGDLRIIKSNGQALEFTNSANLVPAGKTYTYTCEEGVILRPVKDSKTLFEVVSDNTVKAVNTETGDTYYSSKGGYLGIPEGSYNITKSDTDYYTNDGSTITILRDTALTFNDMLYRSNDENGVFAGWCYEGSKTGPQSGEVLAAGTVLKANYVKYDPAGQELGIIGLQIRVADSKYSQGLRFVINKDNTFGEKFEVAEYGAVLLPKRYIGEQELVVDGRYEFNEKTYKAKHVLAKNTFETTDNGLLYTLCLVGIEPEKYNEFYTARAYAVCKSANGGTFTVYSSPVSSSLVNVTRNNEPRNETDAQAFEEIVSAWKNTYFGEGTTAVSNSKYDTAYTVNSSGVSVREITIDSGNDVGRPVQIAVITDSHLNTNIPGHTEALVKAMECASFADQTVLCGDNVESVSSDANLALMKQHVWDPYPETIAILGNHEYFYPGSGSMDALKEKVDKFWPHDPDYYSKLIGGKVLVVGVDNARQVTYGESVYYFTEEKCDMLEKDIEYARKNGYTILFFCHVGLSSLDKTFMANGRMYELVTSNADVIKGCFSGHGHVDNKSTLSASYIDENGYKISSTIPYYWLRGCGEDNYIGHVLYVNVE